MPSRLVSRRKAKRREKLRNILLFPLLLLLHLVFTAFSLALRLYEAFAYTPDGSTTPSTKPPPKHVALVLLSESSSQSRNPLRTSLLAVLHQSWALRSLYSRVTLRLRWRASTRRRIAERREQEEERALMESVRRMIKWAGQAGVSELSIYNSRGIMERCRDRIYREYQTLPASPPLSRSPSPPRTKASKATLAAQTESYADVANPGIPTHVGDSTQFDPVTSFTVFPSASPLSVHLLSQDSRDVISHIAKRHTSAEGITQASLDADIKVALHFSSDPELLIVHSLSPPSFLRSLLPRSPPELGGYPFWPLRITEIYHHPTPLPLPPFISRMVSPLISRSRTSSLSSLRKTAKRLPDMKEASTMPGVLDQKEWQGALRAWDAVEQRLGK